MSASKDDSMATLAALKKLLYSVCDNIGNLITLGQNFDGADIICACYLKNLRLDSVDFLKDLSSKVGRCNKKAAFKGWLDGFGNRGVYESTIYFPLNKEYYRASGYCGVKVSYSDKYLRDLYKKSRLSTILLNWKICGYHYNSISIKD